MITPQTLPEKFVVMILRRLRNYLGIEPQIAVWKQKNFTFPQPPSQGLSSSFPWNERKEGEEREPGNEVEVSLDWTWLIYYYKIIKTSPLLV